MAQKPDLYAELGIARDAGIADVDRAYRRKARRAHPDAGGSAEAFHALAHAHAILSDPERRKAYDETGYQGELLPDDIATRAMERIHELVASVLDSDLPFETVDLIAAIRDTLVGQKAEIGAGIRRMERQASRAEELARRFRRRSGSNFIRLQLERRAEETRSKAEKTRREEAVFAKAIELLADYDFERDPPLERAQPSAAAAKPGR